ncbi:MAG: hypothetical protein J6Q47_00805, partial [Paludibacteraceae bacterium]|nr:hypothetical protein [Paludibacteraceae bacterium]
MKTLSDEQILKLPNAICECRTIEQGGFSVVALIKLKNSYSYENDYLKNKFAEDFELSSQIKIEEGIDTDEFAVFSRKGNYLFSLKQNPNEVPQFSVYVSWFFWILAFLLFFYSYIRQDWFWGIRICKLKYFVIITLVYFLLLCLFFYFDYPEVVFTSELFSLANNSSGFLFPSLGHLVFITFFLLASTSVFAHKIVLPKVKLNEHLFVWVFLIQFLSVLYFAVIYVIFFDLLSNSTYNI